MCLMEESEACIRRAQPEGSANARFVLRWEEDNYEDAGDDDEDDEPARRNEDKGYDDEDEYDDE